MSASPSNGSGAPRETWASLIDRQRRERHELVVSVLVATAGNKEETARLLGMHRNSVRNVVAQLPDALVPERARNHPRSAS